MSKEKIEMDERAYSMIKYEIGGMWGGLEMASIQHFVETGNISGSFLLRLKSLMIKYAKHSNTLAISGNIETNNNWLKISKDGLPKVGEPVEVVTEFLRNGHPSNERFIGYLDEYGELISYPCEDEYGWPFNDCVYLWRRLSPLPCE